MTQLNLCYEVNDMILIETFLEWIDHQFWMEEIDLNLERGDFD